MVKVDGFIRYHKHNLSALVYPDGIAYVNTGRVTFEQPVYSIIKYQHGPGLGREANLAGRYPEMPGLLYVGLACMGDIEHTVGSQIKITKPVFAIDMTTNTAFFDMQAKRDLSGGENTGVGGKQQFASAFA